MEVPWFPAEVEPNENAFWAHIDVDVLKLGSPMWTFPGHLRLQGHYRPHPRSVAHGAEGEGDAAPSRRRPRRAASASPRSARRGLRRPRSLPPTTASAGAINPHYFMAELGKVLDDEDIIFNEAVTNTPAVLMQIPRRVPNTAFNTNGAGLGWSGAMALGAKLAAPNRMMVQVAGDGSFYFCNPTSVFAVAQQYGLPFLSIVLDNSGWSAVKQSTLRVYPEGDASITNEFEAELAPKVEFGKVAEAFGAYAEKVSDPAEVPAAIARCAKEVRGGRAALLHVKVTRM